MGVARNEPRERRPNDGLPPTVFLADGEGRDGREEGEVDRERLAVVGPDAPPEDHPDEDWRDVVARIRSPDERGEPDDDEQADRDAAEEDPPPGPEDEPLP